jgi:uncharacterized DUF497 family protein
MDDGEFSWDDAKAAANLAKHGVSFGFARRVFEDPLRPDWNDTSERYDEDRYATIGMVDERLFFVAYTMEGEDGEKTHIISAREAEPYERRRYHEENDI